MKQFIDKLIGRLEENIFVAELHGFGWDGQRVSNLLCLGDVKDISEQLAEEYNQDSTKYNRDKTIGDCIRGMNNRELAVFLKPFMTRFLTEDEIVAWLEEEMEG